MVAWPTACMRDVSKDNPLVSSGRTDGLPEFDRVRPQDAEPAIDAVLAENRARLVAVLADAGSPDASADGEALVEPLAEMHDRLARAWGPVSHLFGVTSTREWRDAYNACLPKVTAYDLELSQSEPLFRAYERIGASPSFATLPAARQKVVKDALRDFRLSGVSLPEGQKARFKDTALRLSALEAKFEENLLDSIQAFGKHVADGAALAGMTEQGKAAASAKARAKNLEGFRLTLDTPSYDAVVTYADNRELRRELYEAYATRASDEGPLAGRFDNGALIEEILALRHEQAHLLGLRNYAEMSLAVRMAESPDEVERFLLDLNARARPRAVAEVEELRAFARELDRVSDFQPWDTAYYAEKLKARRLGFSEDELRPYFPLPQVVAGMFALVERLYGVRIERTDGIATWHPDVTTYAVREAGGNPIGLFYLDPYAREDKRGGAWMDECVGPPACARRRSAPRRVPDVQLRPASRRAAGALDAHRSAHALSRVRPWLAPPADEGRRGRRLGAARRGEGRDRAAQSVHGKLVLRGGHAAGAGAPLEDRRGVAGRPPEEGARRPHVQRRPGNGEAARVRPLRSEAPP